MAIVKTTIYTEHDDGSVFKSVLDGETEEILYFGEVSPSNDWSTRHSVGDLVFNWCTRNRNLYKLALVYLYYRRTVNTNTG